MPKGRHGFSDSSYFLGQRPYMIELITKKLKINCSKCDGVGHDHFQQLCFKCDGEGHTLVPVSLFEMIGMVHICGFSHGEDEVTYNVDYFKLYHVKEDERAAISKRAWKSYDDGPDTMALNRDYKLDVTQKALFVTFNVAMEEAHDCNIALLGDIEHKTKIDLINQFNDTVVSPGGTPIVDAITNDYASLMGEYPELTYVSGGVTEDEFKRVLGPVDIEQALT